MTPLSDSPLDPEFPEALQTDTEHVARCAYLSRVQFAQRRCEEIIAAARTVYLRAEQAAWITYQASSPHAVRAWLSPPGDDTVRPFIPDPDSHPYPPEG